MADRNQAMTRREMRSRASIPAWLTFWWGTLFGLWNLSWSLGGEVGLDLLAESLQEDARAGETSLLIVNTVGGLGKIAIGLLALGTISAWGRLIPRTLHLGLLYVGGVLLILYGGANWTQMLLAETGAIAVPESVGESQVRWYLILWEPLWLVGGVLMILTAEAYRRR